MNMTHNNMSIKPTTPKYRHPRPLEFNNLTYVKLDNIGAEAKTAL